MKYSAKRTWPEKPKVWEFKGEAETAEAFAVEFASTQDLRLGTEIVVMQRETDDAEIEFFRVSNTSPHQVIASAGGETGAQADASEASAGGESGSRAVPLSAESEANTAYVPSIRPFSSMIFYMVKVGFIATLVIGGLGYLLKYLRGG